MKTPSLYDTYRQKPSPEGLRAVVDEHRNVIDGTVFRVLGRSPSQVVRDRADLLAAKAIRAYDPSTGVPLKHWIQQGLRPIDRVAREVTEPISVPEQARREYAHLRRAREELHERLGREPSDTEVGDHTGFSVRKQRRLEQAAFPTAEGFLAGMRTDDVDVDPAVSADTTVDDVVAYVVHDLDPVDQQIYAGRTGSGGRQRSVAELARALNISAAAVSQRATRIQKRIEQAVRDVGST